MRRLALTLAVTALFVPLVWAVPVPTKDKPAAPKNPVQYDLSGGPAAVIQRIALAVKQDELPMAHKLAQGFHDDNRNELEDAMAMFKLKRKGGLAWLGAQAADGIELRIRVTARNGPGNADVGIFEQMADTITAVGLVAQTYTPVRIAGNKGRDSWAQANQALLDGAQALAKAAQAKNLDSIKAAAIHINNACNACHSVHRN
jgi:hypothetical protein